MYCANCGTRVRAGKVCSSCGTALVAKVPTATEAFAARTAADTRRGDRDGRGLWATLKRWFGQK